MNEVYREIEQHIPDLKRYARVIAGDAVSADDLVQDSLLRALTKSDLYRPGTNLRAWLFTIMHNQHVSDIRRKSRIRNSVDPDDAAWALATRPNQEAGLVTDAVQRALGALPDAQRILIERVALDGRSYEDVARCHGLSLGTVKSRISRGRSMLRQALEGHACYERPAARARANRSSRRAQPASRGSGLRRERRARLRSRPGR